MGSKPVDWDVGAALESLRRDRSCPRVIEPSPGSAPLWGMTDSVGTEKCPSNALTARGPRPESTTGATGAIRQRLDVAAFGDRDDHAGQLIHRKGRERAPLARAPLSRRPRAPIARAARARRAASPPPDGVSRAGRTPWTPASIAGRRRDPPARPIPGLLGRQYIARRHGPADPLGAPVPTPVEEGEEQSVLVGEVGVEGALGQPCPGADVRYGGRAVSLFGEELHCRIEQGRDRDRPALGDSSWHGAHCIAF